MKIIGRDLRKFKTFKFQQLVKDWDLTENVGKVFLGYSHGCNRQVPG